MVQVPPRELACRNAARHRVQKTQQAFRDRMAPLEDRVVDDFVKQDGEVEDREALDYRERDPDERMLEPDQSPRRGPRSQTDELQSPGAGAPFRCSARICSREMAAPSSARSATAWRE